MHEAARELRDDTDSGAAALSLRALDALREAAEATEDPTELVGIARDLRDARPAMTAIANRVNRVMATADSDAPADIAAAADRVRAAAADADRAAAREAAGRLGDRILTLSRSETAIEAIQSAAPDRVFVAESRPANEGVGVAEELADALDVTVHTDAAVAAVLADHDVDAVVTGADTIAPDGRVLNKTGTRAAALAAHHEGVPHVVVAARDKVAPDAGALEREHGDPTAIYDGAADIDVYAATFDVTPADRVTVVTEHGLCSSEKIAAIAAEHREHAAWDDQRCTE